MWNFLKQLFNTPKYGMGSLENLPDSRNIDISRIQTPLSIPERYIVDITLFGINNQGGEPICVGESFAKLAEYYVYKKTNKIVKFDGKKFYQQCKAEDGIPNIAGTYSSVAAKILIRDGIDQYNVESNDKVATGYAFVPIDFESISQAIYQNGMITVGLHIDENWFKGIIGRALRYIGGHQTNFIGYDKSLERIYGINSWGADWIGNIAGYIDPNVMPGCYVAKFQDIKDSFINIIAFLPIPKEIIEDVKNTDYKFITTMRFGTTSYEVKELQKRLGVSLITGYFGSLTKQKVIEYQIQNGLLADGIVGPLMRTKLNGNTKSYITQLAEAIKQHEGYFKGSKSYRNHSPGNFKPGTLTAYMKKLGAIGIDDGGFAFFPNYETGFNALCTFLKDACSDKLNAYRGSMTISDFFHKYAPSSENNTLAYIGSVCKRLGVEKTLQIKELL